MSFEWIFYFHILVPYLIYNIKTNKYGREQNSQTFVHRLNNVLFNDNLVTRILLWYRANFLFFLHFFFLFLSSLLPFSKVYYCLPELLYFSLIRKNIYFDFSQYPTCPCDYCGESSGRNRLLRLLIVRSYRVMQCYTLVLAVEECNFSMNGLRSSLMPTRATLSNCVTRFYSSIIPQYPNSADFESARLHKRKVRRMIQLYSFCYNKIYSG